MQMVGESTAVPAPDPSGTMSRSGGRVALWLRVVLALVALTVSLIGSHPRIGLTVDSGEYLAVADGIGSGHGLTMPYLSYGEPYPVESSELGKRVELTVFPPAYPILLAAADAALPGGVTAAARGVAAMAFAVTTLALTTLCRRRWTAVLTTLGLLTYDMVTVQSTAWSEGPLIAFTAAAAMFATRYVASRRRSDLAFLCLAVAAASGTRFIGTAVGLGIAVGLAVCLKPERRPALLVAVAGALPTALWFVRNSFVLGRPSEKVISWHPPGPGTVLDDVVATLGRWTINDGPWSLLLLLPAVALIVTMGPNRDRQATARLRIGLAGAVVYMVGLLAARTLIDVNIPIDSRLLSPAHLFLLVAVMAAGDGAPAGTGFPARRLAASLAAISLLLGAFVGVRRAVDISGIEPSGYSGRRWIESEGIAYIDALPDETTVLTNAPDAVWLLTGHESLLFFPMERSTYTGERNGDYDAQLAALSAKLRETPAAVVVVFHRPTDNGVHRFPERAKDGLDLVLVRDMPDADVYEVTGQ